MTSKLIAEGGYATVYNFSSGEVVINDDKLGELKNKIKIGDVAIKIEESKSGDFMSQVVEFDILRMLFHSPYVTHMVGLCDVKDAKILLPQLSNVDDSKLSSKHIIMEMGSMDLYTWALYGCYVDDNVKWNHFIKIIKDVFLGLLQLSASGIMHRDIKSSNIMIKIRCNKKHKRILSCCDVSAFIIDYGLSMFNSMNSEDASVNHVMFRPPECLKISYYGVEADIWSWGFTMYWVVYGTYPYGIVEEDDKPDGSMLPDTAIKKIIANNHRDITKQIIHNFIGESYINEISEDFVPGKGIVNISPSWVPIDKLDELNSLILSCIEIDYKDRCTPQEALKYDLLSPFPETITIINRRRELPIKISKSKLRSDAMELINNIYNSVKFGRDNKYRIYSHGVRILELSLKKCLDNNICDLDTCVKLSLYISFKYFTGMYSNKKYETLFGKIDEKIYNSLSNAEDYIITNILMDGIYFPFIFESCFNSDYSFNRKLFRNKMNKYQSGIDIEGKLPSEL